MRIRCVVVFIFLCAASSSATAGQAAAQTPAGEDPQRTAARKLRVNIARGFADARKRELRPYVDALNGAVKWLAAQNARDEAADLVEEIRDIDPQCMQLKEAESAVAAVSAPAALSEAKQKEWAVRQRALVSTRSQGLLRLANVCYGAGLLGYAYDLVEDILEDDPQNAVARGALGHVKIGEQWHSRFAAAQMQKGLAYVPELGWAPKNLLEKVKAGEWPEGAQLMPMKTADAAHANLATPWEIETDNFILRATTSRKQAMKIAERAEGIRAFVYRQYLDFFQRGSGKAGQMLFNQAPAKKMLIYYFGEKAHYDATIDKDMSGRDTGLLKRSAGFYSGSTGASYFYHRADYGPFLFKLMQHEVTHQILGEYARGANPPTWLTEGLAEVLEYAEVDEAGRYSLPSGRAHADVEAAARLQSQNQLGSVSSLLGMPNAQFHAEPGRAKNYKFAGAFCRFVLEHQDGMFANDFLDFAFDQYKSGKGSLFGYIGGDMAHWESAFKEYLSGKESPSESPRCKKRDRKRSRSEKPEIKSETKKDEENPFKKKEKEMGSEPPKEENPFKK